MFTHKLRENKNNKLWAHLHCIDIDKFDVIYNIYKTFNDIF